MKKIMLSSSLLNKFTMKMCFKSGWHC